MALKFNTGRGYTARGQRISAAILPDGRVAFNDHDRGIKGRTRELCPVICESNIQYWLMVQYDHNLYDDLAKSELPADLLEY